MDKALLRNNPLSYIILTILSISFISFFSFCSTPTSAATSTLNLTLSDSNVTMNIAPTSTNGSFSKSSTSTISASTNNATGYTLSIAASSSDTNASKLINTSDSTSALNSITSATTEEQFKALSATTYNNMWGYLPSKYCSDGTNATCTTNTFFLPVPSISGDILDQTSTANTTANNYTIAIGARIDSTTKTGTYQNTYVVKLVANAIPYSISYDDNVVSNMPTDISSTTTGTSVTIDNKTPVRAGYKFLGWCTTIPTNNNGTDTCTGGTQYQPSATLTIDQTGTGNNFHLYAMWKESTTFNKAYAAAGKTQSGGYYIMQDANASICSAVDEGEVGEVKDSRDGAIYHIGKLKDGKCWMVENLNLAGDLALSAENTDVDATYINSFTTSNNLTKDGNTIKLPASATTGFDQYNYSFVYNSGNTTNCGASGQNTPCYSYYSWDAATLGSGRTIETENTDAPYSICPKGWRLPNSGNSSNNEWKRGDFYKLATAYGANLESNYYDSSSATGSNFYNNAGPGTAPGFLLAGHYRRGSFYYGGNRGYYWSSTSSSSTSGARSLYSNSGYVYSAYVLSRYYGFNVRCHLRD